MSTFPIGIFDSGVGGLTVARAVREALPHESLVYLGDTARVPYGDKSAKTVTAYSLEIASALVSRGVKTIVVACNTASALAIEPVRDRFPDLPVHGVIAPGAGAAAAASQNHQIGVIGTRATVSSRAYERAIHDRLPSATVHAAPCPLFVPLVEEEWLDTPVTRQVVAHYIGPLLEKGIDTLLLGCTHYPFLAAAIRAHAGPGVTVVDSATATAAHLKTLLADNGIAAPPDNTPSLDVILTDAPDRFLTIANRHLGLALDPAAIKVVPPDQFARPGN